jgi:hypothetical protein
MGVSGAVALNVALMTGLVLLLLLLLGYTGIAKGRRHDRLMTARHHRPGRHRRRLRKRAEASW